MSELVGGIPSDPALTGLPVPVLTEDTGLRDALTRITLFGHQAVAGCAAVSITLIECGCAVTMGSSSDVAVKLDDVQYGDGDGPCLTAAREQRVIRVDDRAIDPRWPHYSQVSEQLGIRSSLSLPLILGNDQLHGGFNVY